MKTLLVMGLVAALGVGVYCAYKDPAGSADAVRRGTHIVSGAVQQGAQAVSTATENPAKKGEQAAGRDIAKAAKTADRLQ